MNSKQIKYHREKLAREILDVVKDIDDKLSHVIKQLREDLYVLVPRKDDEILGGGLRDKRKR
jgi:hypothetical protein